MTRLLSSLRDNWSRFGERYSWKGRLFLVCASAFRSTFFHPDVFSASSGPHIQSACPRSIHTTSEQSRYFPHFSPWVAAFGVRHRRPSQTWFDKYLTPLLIRYSSYPCCLVLLQGLVGMYSAQLPFDMMSFHIGCMSCKRKGEKKHSKNKTKECKLAAMKSIRREVESASLYLWPV